MPASYLTVDYGLDSEAHFRTDTVCQCVAQWASGCHSWRPW